MTNTEFFDTSDRDDEYWETMGQADGTGAPTGTVTPAEPEDSDGTSAPTEPDADTEPEAVEEEVPSEETPEEEPEPEGEPDDATALREQIATLEKRIADKDDFNGRLSNELGELRQLQQQMLEQQQRPQVSDWESLIDDNPARAAQVALEAGNNYAYQQAREAWEEMSPGAPDMFEHNLRLQRQMAELQQQVQATTAPLHQQRATQQITEVLAEASQRYEDFDQHEQAMAEIVSTRPMMKKMFEQVLNEGTREEQEAYVDDLYRIASGRKADTLTEAAKKVAREQATETLRAKQEAQLASASASMDTEQARTASQKIADQIGAEWDDIAKPYEEGWQIRPV